MSGAMMSELPWFACLDGRARGVAEVEGRTRTIQNRLATIGSEIDAAQAQEIDEHNVAGALEAFGPVWDSLWPMERSRILGLLVERVDYDGRDERLAIRFRSDGVATLTDDRPS